MDYLNPEKEKRHQILLMVGYVFVTVAIIIATLVLVYQAYGFGITRDRDVIQNGLIFVSSHPDGGQIYLNDTLYKSQTNTRALLPAGIYRLKITAAGYNDWQRTIEVNGGSIAHYDYPTLFPQKLVTNPLVNYTAQPGLATQSLDRRWLLVQQVGSNTIFDRYDLRSPTKTVTSLTIPATILSKATSSESWQATEWANDNQHVVLEHLYDNKTEYILVDTENPEQSVNLNTALSTSPVKLSLNNRRYDQYYLSDANGAVQTATLKQPVPVTLLSNVLAYQTYGNDQIIYATNTDAPAGKVLIKLKNGDRTYTVRSFPAGTTYLVAMTEYGGTPYVSVGAASENKAYIYKDPIAQLAALPNHAVTPIQVLHVDSPDYLSFSTNAQFIVLQHGTQFGVYDIENKSGYNYVSKLPMDAPQLHATWMDGNRLTYVSNGKLAVFDYDNLNPQLLSAADPAYLPFFSPDFKYLYTLAASSAHDSVQLTQTSLLVNP